MNEKCEHKTADVLLDFNGVTVADCTHGCGRRLIVGQPFDDDWQSINEEWKRLYGDWLFVSPTVTAEEAAK